MSFKTTNGSIKLYLPEDFGADAELKTTNGHIDSDFEFTEKIRKSRILRTQTNTYNYH